MYKIIFLVFSIVLLSLTFVSTLFPEGTWEVVRESEFKMSFTGVRFFDTNHGVVWADKGYVARTFNGGKDWALKQIGGGGAHSGSRPTYFTSEGEGWVIWWTKQKGHIVYHSKDGGKKWEEWQPTFEPEIPDLNIYPVGLYFLNGKEGWLIVTTGGGFGEQIFHTDDGGKHWKLQLDAQKRLGALLIFLSDIYFVDAQNGWAVGHAWVQDAPENWTIFAFLFRTSDGGQNWSLTKFDAESEANKVFFRTPTVGWMSMRGSGINAPGGAIFHTTDGGQTWEKQLDMRAIGFHFQNQDEGWATTGKHILHTLDGGKMWKVQFDVEWWVEGIHFINTNEGWAAGGYGTIIHTADGGETWERSGGKSFGPLYAVDFTNPQNGWAVGSELLHTSNGIAWTQRGGLIEYPRDVDFVNSDVGWILAYHILHTGDAGTTWIKQLDGSGKSPEAICFINENEGWVVGSLGDILHTGDGGITWIHQKNVGANLRDVFFVDSSHGWTVGFRIVGVGDDRVSVGVAFHTEDGGINWEEQEGNFLPLNGVHFVDENEGWCIGTFTGTSSVFHTSNGGKDWERQTSIDGIVSALHFVSENEGWIVGMNGDIYHTKDGGNKWEIQKSFTSDDLDDICYDGGIHMYAVGMWGVILRYTDEELRRFGWSVPYDSDKLKTSWGFLKNALYQNYPNPFNPETFIPYQLASDSGVKIKIYDVSGKLVHTLNIGQRKAGLYVDREKAASWDGRNQQGEPVTSGIYFYQFATDNFSATKRMLIAK